MNIPESSMTRMNKGGTLDLGFCSITMVSADHSSGCLEGKTVFYGGDPAGFVISAKDARVYHAGDTNVFGDMSLITELYAPTHALLPIGGHSTMGPREAALAVCKFLTTVKVVIPMHFGTFPFLKGTVEEFEKFMAEYSKAYERGLVKVFPPSEFTESKDLPQ